MAEILCKDESYAVMGACFEVYSVMGSGFLERMYQECLEIEFSSRKIPAFSQCPVRLSYKYRELRSTYVPDFVCYGKMILEVKGVSEISDSHRAQVLHYLRASGLRLGLLVNFGRSRSLQWERLVF